jgi:hypothetical protein
LRNFAIIFSLGLALQACKSFPIDPSIAAAEANDYTLIASACEAMPGRGADICRVKEGTTVSSGWRLIVPTGDKILGGEVTIYYKDFSKSYGVTDKVIEVPWRDLVTDHTWKESHDGIAVAIAQIRYVDPGGIEKIMRARGMAIINVLKPGYDPMPIDSGFAAWKTECKVEYSTAGRGALGCE